MWCCVCARIHSFLFATAAPGDRMIRYMRVCVVVVCVYVCVCFFFVVCFFVPTTAPCILLICCMCLCVVVCVLLCFFVCLNNHHLRSFDILYACMCCCVCVCVGVFSPPNDRLRRGHIHHSFDTVYAFICCCGECMCLFFLLFQRPHRLSFDMVHAFMY